MIQRMSQMKNQKMTIQMNRIPILYYLFYRSSEEEDEMNEENKESIVIFHLSF